MNTNRQHLHGLACRACLAAVLCLLVIAPAAYAQQLENLLAESDLVFFGRVSHIEYRLSDQRGPTDARLPHTFVTYTIERIVHGRYQKPTLTLRFLGGPTGVDGRVILPQRFPLFRAGNHDILFVRNNGRTVCPLVGCSRGRLRVVEGHVYSDRGRAFLIAPTGGLVTANRGLGPEHIRMEIPPAPADYLARERARLAAAKNDLQPDLYRQQAKRLAEISAIRVIALPSDYRSSKTAMGLADHRAAEFGAVLDLVAQLAGDIDTTAAEPVADQTFGEPFYFTRPQPVRDSQRSKTRPNRRQSSAPEVGPGGSNQ